MQSIALAALLAVTGLSSSAAPRRPSVEYVNIASSSFVAEKLPLSYCQTWPLFCAAPSGEGGQTLRHVNPPQDDDAPVAWVDPLTFEDLWLPEDLPTPRFHLALTFVLKDGTPRFVSPSVDATLFAAGREWRNRGMRSVPMPKTWLPWLEVPVAQLRISAYVQPPVEGDGADGTLAARAPFEPLAVLLPVDSGFAAAAEVLAEAPSALASGFSYLTVRLPLGESAQLASESLRPGARLRVFLSDADSFPASIDSGDGDGSGSGGEEYAWVRGECDISLMQIAPGGTSKYLPDVYKPLYGLSE